MSVDNSKRLKKLFLKAEYLAAELEETQDLFGAYSAEFSKELNSLKKKRKSNPITDCSAEIGAFLELEAQEAAAEAAAQEAAESCEEELPPRPELPADFKRVYKKIMTIVHPDKLEFMEDAKKKERYMHLASIANDAANDLNWYDMAKIAIELNIDMGEVSDQQIAGMEESCNKVLKEVSAMKNSYPWTWALAGDAEKEIVFNYYVENVL